MIQIFKKQQTFIILLLLGKQGKNWNPFLSFILLKEKTDFAGPSRKWFHICLPESEGKSHVLKFYVY